MENINLNDSNRKHEDMSDVNMVYSCLLHKDGKRIVHVTFERTGAAGYEYAEGIVPDGIIERQKGFTKEEVTKLESYLKAHVEEIFSRAKEISGLKYWMR